MPTTKSKSVPNVKRDKVIAEAVNQALYAMRLLDGRVLDGGVARLHFDHEMLKLEKALELLRGGARRCCGDAD